MFPPNKLAKVRAGNAAWRVRRSTGEPEFLARAPDNNLQFTKEES
jgi:hypothetical protein